MVRSLLHLLCLLSVVLIWGCNNNSDINAHFHSRHVLRFTEILDNPGQVIHREETVNGEPHAMTRFVLEPGDINSSACIVQDFDVHKNSRLKGIRFLIRNVTPESSNFIASLHVLDGPPGVFIYTKPIITDTANWNTVTLLFSDFTDASTRLELTADTLHPSYYNKLKLMLMPSDQETSHKLIVDWGALEPVYDHHRYRYY